MKENNAGNEVRESRRSGGKGMFVPLQAMNVYKGKPRLWEEINREFLAPVTVPLGTHTVFRLGPRDSLEVLNNREIF